MKGFPWFRDIAHQNHARIPIGFVAVPAKVARFVPFLQTHAADEKAAHLTKSEGSLEKRIGCAHWSPLCRGLSGGHDCFWPVQKVSMSPSATSMPERRIAYKDR
jgi:hypothetical protein